MPQLPAPTGPRPPPTGTARPTPRHDPTEAAGEQHGLGTRCAGVIRLALRFSPASMISFFRAAWQTLTVAEPSLP